MSTSSITSGGLATGVSSLASVHLKQSRVGKQPIPLVAGVTVSIAHGSISVQGPKGASVRQISPNVSVTISAGQVSVAPTVPGRDGARYQGLARSVIQGMITGASVGYVKTLQLVGTGYRAEVKGRVLNLALGFSHPVNFPIPEGVKVEIPTDSKGTLIVLSGPDKGVMGQTAATIRGFRPPEPYGGKGVRFQGEKVREKAGKAAKGGK